MPRMQLITEENCEKYRTLVVEYPHAFIGLWISAALPETPYLKVLDIKGSALITTSGQYELEPGMYIERPKLEDQEI